jgi:lipopolysaccharide/colanic/teichoic acid biosynthesis glycosyltransferase
MHYFPFFKRLLDFSAALAGLLILWPLLLLTAVMIKLDSKGDIFYRQQRIGQHLKPFHILKFRSMVQNADLIGTHQTQSNDARISRIGHFLRRSSLDELPQLINVLKGDMSLIGPRPDTPIQQSDYTPERWQARHKIKPGITGLAQVSGRSNMSAETRLQHDLSYAKNISLKGDINILWQTAQQVLKRKGVN